MAEQPLSKTIDGDPQDLHAGLNRELALVWLAGWVALLSCFTLFLAHWTRTAALQWLVQSALLWLLVGYQAYTRLILNRPGPDEPLFPHLGWGNRITLLRGLLTAMTGGFIFLAEPSALLAWLPGALYLLAAVADRLDGYVARICRHQTLFGTEIDTEMDALGLAVAPLLAVWYGQVHWSYLLVSVAYYSFRGGIYWRRWRGLPVHPLRPNLSRRAVAGFQMGFIAVALLPVFEPPFTTIAGFAFMVPLLAGFLLDWLTVSGLAGPAARGRDALARSMAPLSKTILLPGLRLLIAALLLVSIARSGYALLPSLSGPVAGPAATYAALGLAGLLLLGALGRMAALGLTILLGWRALGGGVNPIDMVLLFSAIFVMIMGTGRYSLWRWDERWINRYDGA